MSKFAIVAVSYNRDKSLDRLLQSLSQAYYDEQVTLIISIDKSDNGAVYQVADGFEWKFGEKRIRTFEQRQGLRKHVLSCGQFLDEFEAIAVLEDDLLVAEGFFTYMKEAVKFYEDDLNIAGISLYSHQWNQIANIPFQPIITEYDNYFMQMAQSWGQVWLRQQWKAFSDWYSENIDIFKKEAEYLFPKVVSEWSDSSWLKYHIRYCVDKNKYFVYPYISYTTNFTEIGEHYKCSINRFQVPYLNGFKIEYKFVKYLDESVRYDSFFENITLQEELEKNFKTACVDLNGQKDKQFKGRYLLTTKSKNYLIVKRFGLHLRPIEMNVMKEIMGNDIFLYDLSKKNKYKGYKGEYKIKIWDYYMKERFMHINEVFSFIKKRLENMKYYIFH